MELPLARTHGNVSAVILAGVRMSTSTIVIIAVAVILFAILLLVLARTGRKRPEGPADADGIAMVRPATELSPAADPLPEPTAVPGVPASEIAPPPVPIANGPPDPLTRMKGLGPKAEATLNGLGIARYDQIAAWGEADIARVDAQMGAFKGRIARDRWVEQARYLAAGDTAGFEAVFGKLG
jgi:predicted flap endonuclease-1-like 5' DNA nuclease